MIVDDKKEKKGYIHSRKWTKSTPILSTNRYHRSNLRFSALLTPREARRVALSFIKFKGRSSIFINSKKKRRRGKKNINIIHSFDFIINLVNVPYVKSYVKLHVKLPKFSHVSKSEEGEKKEKKIKLAQNGEIRWKEEEEGGGGKKRKEKEKEVGRNGKVKRLR